MAEKIKHAKVGEIMDLDEVRSKFARSCGIHAVLLPDAGSDGSVLAHVMRADGWILVLIICGCDG